MAGESFSRAVVILAWTQTPPRNETQFMKFVRSLTFISLVLLAVAASAEDKSAALREILTQMIPGQKPDAVEQAPVEGLYQVRYGAQVFYMTEDGRYLLEGSLVDLKDRRNFTAEARSAGRKAAIDAIPEDQMIVFGPKKPKHTITVFTDIDCPYCQKLHHEIDQYAAQGIEVRYLFFPRAGLGSASYDTSVSVWCAKDRKAALTRAKNGEKIEHKTCENPVADQFKLGHQLGVAGTPAIILEDGELVPGYQPAAELAKALDQRASLEKVSANGDSK